MSNTIQAIVMPRLGLSMTEGIVAKWHVTAGTKVSSGDVIADIETSKITNELEVHCDGVIRGELAEEGIELPIGALLGLIADECATDGEIEKFIARFVPEEKNKIAVESEGEHAQEAVAENAGDKTATAISPFDVAVSIPDALKGEDDDSAVSATHLARKLAGQFDINLKKVTGTGRRGRISKNDIEQAVHAAGGSLSAKINDVLNAKLNATDSHVPATPLARRMANQAGVDLATITASGSRGRVTKSDVENAIGILAPTSIDTLKHNIPAGTFEEVPLTPIGRIIAGRLTESKQNAPHFRVAIEANIDHILILRTELNQEIENGKISVNDILIKAVAETLVNMPDVNIQFDGNIIRRFVDVDVAVAVALDGGLVTPIIRAANKKSITDISREMTELVKRARSGTLMPDEFEGGTFTLSNLGMFGVKAFDAIINPPQAAILAVGAGEKRRILSGEKDIIATVITATLSCDHRVIDGVTGARFMQELKEVIEHPFRMLMI